jgi:hypothetical protein
VYNIVYMPEGDRSGVEVRKPSKPTREQGHLVFGVRSLMAVPPRNLNAFEAELAQLVKEVKTPNMLTNETMEGLIEDKEIYRFEGKRALHDLLRSLRIPGTKIQAFDGTFTVAVAEPRLGNIQYAEIPGELHEITKEDGSLLFPGGLTRYAWAKMLNASALTTLSPEKSIPDGSMKSVEDAEYIKSVETSEETVHMGSATYVDAEGNTYVAGVSGAEMTHEALDYIMNMLPEASHDDRYTIAGILDGLVAHWAARMMAGEEVIPALAQRDFEMLIKEIKGKVLPQHYH